MSRLVDIDNYLVLENGTIKETSFKQDIQIQNQTLMINEDAKVQIIYKTTEEGTYQFNIEIKDRLHVDLVEMYEASKSCSYTKNIKINESSEVLRYVELNSHQNIQLDLDENGVGAIAFNIKNVFSQDGASLFNTYGIAIRAGQHCAKILDEYLHVSQTLRASFYFYNTKEEIDQFIEVCKKGDDFLDAFFG